MASNPWGCETFFQGDIIIAERDGLTQPFSQWSPSNLQRSISNEGAPCGVLRDDATFDVFVFTQNPGGTDDLDIMFLRNIPRNPTDEHARPIVGTSGDEDNPHIERLDDGSLLLIFDRDRYMYYSLSTDNGDTWSDPVLITNILNDQAPYDVQPHLWNDGSDWWVYFCADNEYGRRSIYRSKQETGGDWDSWGAPELVIAPDEVVGGYGTIIGVGEPTLTERGDISFVAVYGFLESADTTDVYDCDPWFLPRK
jgi:hypothetical protein